MGFEDFISVWVVWVFFVPRQVRGVSKGPETEHHQVVRFNIEYNNFGSNQFLFNIDEDKL